MFVSTPPPPPTARWSEQRAANWYAPLPWLVGANFIPSNAINPLEMLQADYFDPATIDRELGYAEALGMNTVRIFLHDLLWDDDPAGLRRRVDQLLALAAKHNIRPMLVLFDSCWDPTPRLGLPPLPRPGVHNSGWVQSPGKQKLHDPAAEPQLQAYVTGIVQSFAHDDRILAWDVWNEPDNPGSDLPEDVPVKVARVDELLPKVFAWARAAAPSQPLTSGVWIGDWSGSEHESSTARIQLDQSDIITFHNYGHAPEFEASVHVLERYNRPILCTEYMARTLGSTFAEILPVAKRLRVAALNWGFVAGKTQTIFGWETGQHPFPESEPPMWFHDILRPDGTPYQPSEVELIRHLTGRESR